MNTTVTRTMIVIGALLSLGPRATATWPESCDGEQWPSRQQQEHLVDSQERGIVYLSDIDASDDVVPLRYCDTSCDAACGDEVGCACPESNCYDGYGHNPNVGMYYAEVQMTFLRAHLLEESIGKLSEKYEFTPRFVMGYETPCGTGGRIRYWTYGRTTPNLSTAADALSVEFDVIDLEGTHRFRTSRSELVIGGGFRWSTMEFEVNDESVDSEMPGITFAADLRGLLSRSCRSQWGAVCGARWTILGGDWQGDDFGLIEPNRDDNIVTHEFYGGFEYLRHFPGYDLYARAVFEVQNWRSDAMGQTAGADSIGFVGPGIHVGAEF